MLLEALKVKNVNLKWDFLNCRKLNNDFLGDCLKKLNPLPDDTSGKFFLLEVFMHICLPQSLIDVKKLAAAQSHYINA